MRKSLSLILIILFFSCVVGIGNIYSSVDANSSFGSKPSRIPMFTVFEAKASVTASGDVTWYRYTVRVKLADRKKVEKRNPRGTWGAWPDGEVDDTVSVDDSCKKFRTSWISQDRLASIEVLYTNNSTDSDISPDPNQSLCKGCWQEGVDHKKECPCGTPYYTCRDDHVDDHDGHEANNNLGISPTDPNQIPSPGGTYEFKVVTDTHYYWIDVFVKAPPPLDTSEKGTKLGNGVLGNGTSTEATFEYTIPTGTSAAFGDYLITAEIWRGTDMSKYTETYTFTVSSD